MPLDPQIAGLLEALQATPVPKPWQVSIDEYRAWNKLPPGAEIEAVARVEEGEIGAGRVAARLYHPGGDAALPLLVYFHGGGFVLGDLETHDNLCRAFCNALPAIVISVDYRLAPEHPFPAAVEDAYAAVCWAAREAEALGADPTRLLVGGDSAGGNLAAVASWLAAQAGGPAIAHQLLLYPVCDADLTRDSYRRLGQGYFLETEVMAWFWEQYLPNRAAADDPRACPLRAPRLDGLPPTTLVTAGLDPLRDEGRAYARRLQEAGVAVEHREYASAIHGFMSFIDGVDLAREAVEEVAARVRVSLAG
ncbi:alpha/beta hydrolase [Halomonas sp. H5]|uniref:alpha/beta hydrolase n=1 Tax=Halomonas sp. H5 TaxID=3423910 RepID=UPI003D36BFE0